MAIDDYPATGREFACDVSTHDGVTFITLSADLDIVGAPRLHEYIQAIVDDQPVDVLVNLEELDFIDSTGISVLVMLCKRVRSHGGSFRISSVPLGILRVLQIAGVTDYLGVEASTGH
jgi:anti-sigma B factor antagonist